MNYLIVYSHPNKSSFNHAIKETVVDCLKKNGHKVKVRDLYENKFNPVLSASDFETFMNGKTPEDIRLEQEYVKWAEKIIFISPLWWTGLPAMMKGYIDRVFARGFAYDYDESGPVQLLIGKEGIFITTTGTPTELYESIDFMNSFINTQDNGILNFCGIDTGNHLFLGAVPRASDEVRAEYLTKVNDTVEKFQK